MADKKDDVVESQKQEKKKATPLKPATKRKRFMKLAGMTMSVAGSFAKTRIKNAFQSTEKAEQEKAENYRVTGELIAQTLGELKGAVMKVGQMASIINDVLPKELTQALTVLQKEAPPMPYEVVLSQIKAEFDATPEELFAWFDEEPFAAASIGQVHRARMEDGREVIVKVQYPGVDESCDSDLAHLKMTFRASGLVKLSRKELNSVFEEIKGKIHDELDYTREAESALLFADFYKDYPQIIIPEVIPERSTEKVLTLGYEPGVHISKIEEQNFSQETRDKIGSNLFHFICSQFFTLQHVHADPQPGNFAFREDGSLVVYDFGCVKAMKPEIVEAYGDTLRAAMVEDYEAVDKGLLALGVRKEEGPPIELEYYKIWKEIFLTPFTQKEPFDYAKSNVHNEVLKQVPGVLKRMRSFKPPVELIFFDRMVVGHYGNLRKLRSVGRFLDILDEYLPLPDLPYLRPDSSQTS